MLPKKAPTQNIYLPTSVLQDATMQPLMKLRPGFTAVKEVPAEIGQNGVAALVFVDLVECFKKAGHISEGKLNDLIWGFEQCGRDPRAVAAGLTKLRELGYIYYTDPTGTRITEHNFDPKKAIWVRYSDKMVNLFAEREKP
jgi:hypothetical protein